jgi:hypothetical protein
VVGSLPVVLDAAVRSAGRRVHATRLTVKSKDAPTYRRLGFPRTTRFLAEFGELAVAASPDVV